MAHLLMIESWVGGTGRLLPGAIRQLGHRYTFVTRDQHHYHDAQMRQIHPVLECADNLLTCETNDLPALIAALRQQHAVLGFDGVLTVCDYYIETVVEVARALELPVAFSSNIAQVRHKHRMREALRRAGLPNPAFRVVGTWEEARRAAEEIGYPLVIKPVDLASSAFVRLAGGESDLRDAFGALANFPLNFRAQPRELLCLLEEYMVGPEVSVEACTFQNDTTLIGITDKSLSGAPYFIEDGHMFPADLDPAVAEAVGDLVLRALRAVGHDHGITHTEVKLTPAGPRIVEINPRPAGNYIVDLVGRVTGIDLLRAMISLALDQRPDLAPRDTGVASAAIAFLVPPGAGRVSALGDTATLDADPDVVGWTLSATAGMDVPAPIDNACYLGHVMAVDRAGRAARQRAEHALRRVELTFENP